MDKILLHGIATVSMVAMPCFADEVAELRSQLETVNKRLEALEHETKTTGWTDRISIKGDFRYRYEYKAEDGETEKSRHRFRARVGAYAQANDEVDAGIRIATGNDDSPTSTNQDIDGYANKKEIWLDLAYLTYDSSCCDGFSATLGKMKQPWVQVSDLIFESNVNPEGIAAAYDAAFGNVSFMSRLGYHIMLENVDNDVVLVSGQVAASSDIGNGLKLTAGIGAFFYNNIEGTEAPGTGGNTVDAATNYVNGIDIVDSFIKLEIDKGPVPFEVFGEYLQNVASGVEEDTAWMVGLGTKYKKFCLEYNYHDRETDSVLAWLADDDLGYPDGKGHKLEAEYEILKNWIAELTYYRVEDNDVDIDLVQASLMVKF